MCSKGVFQWTLVNVIQHRWAVGKFNRHFNFRKFKSKLDSLLGICPLVKKIVHLLIFCILSHVVSGLSTFSGGFLNGKVHKKSYIFQSTSSSGFGKS